MAYAEGKSLSDLEREAERESGVKGEACKGVPDTHSTGQDVKKQRLGTGMSTEGENK